MTSSEKMDNPPVVSDQFLQYLAGELTEEWLKLARNLNISEGKLHDKRADNKENVNEAKYQMLLCWKRNAGQNATHSILAEALLRAGRRDLYNLLNGKCNVRELTGKAKPSCEQATSHSERQLNTEEPFMNLSASMEEKHPNKKQADSKDVKEHKKKRNQLKQQNKEQVHSKDAKKHKKTLDAERQKYNKTFGQVFCLCLVLVPATVVCISFYLRPNIVMQIMNGTLSLLEGARRIEESWQKLSAGSGQHNLVMGKRDSGDQLLYEEKIRKGHSLLPIFYQMHTFTYNCKTNEYITCVVVEDGWDDDTGGDPELVKGGPGKRYVEIKVTSMIGRGMDFSFYVYGRK